METTFTAFKSRSGRPGWSVTFRHPVRRDSRNKLGLKIRRGLDTTDDGRADELVRQLNVLLQDRSWWSADRRADADREFDPIVVSAFFGGMEAGRSDSAALRESKIPLPSKVDGFVRLMLVGTTGAGKTTLLRHLIGSDHTSDRFPSTSTARTTIADTEIVLADGPFMAAITFMSEFEVRAHLDECIEAACLVALEEQSDDKITAALMVHREQRFRLNYILGDGTPRENRAEDEDDFQFDAVEVTDEDGGAVTAEDRAANAARIQSYLSRIKLMTTITEAEVTAEFRSMSRFHATDDPAAWLEVFSDKLFHNEHFSQLALDIKDDIESRFEALPQHILERSSTGWPELAFFECAERPEFLDNVRWFSSNQSSQFGRLLTPLVDGIRVRGPFLPRREELHIAPKLVLIDGEGLGHTTQSASSVSTKVTRRLAEVDFILLVDSAQQPMQAAPLAFLQAVGTSGNGAKIAVAFSHFDQVKGDNLKTTAQKRAHVLANITSATAALRQSLGNAVASTLERRLNERAYLLGALDRDIRSLPGGVISELARLLTAAQESIAPEKPIEVAPRYHVAGLELALRDAVENFLRPWEARLGIVPRDGIPAEHWTRIRALSRRFANDWGDEFDTLRPAGDLIGRLQEQISLWLETPADWTREPSDEAEQEAALNRVRIAIFTALHRLVIHRLGEQHRSAWRTAYSLSGPGSGRSRAGSIRWIYEQTAPPINASMPPAARTFLTEVFQVIDEATESVGGKFYGAKPT